MTALLRSNVGFTLGKAERCLGPQGVQPQLTSAYLRSGEALASHSLRAGTISLSGPQLREKSLLVIDDMVSVA
jgi:hypothetical protein